MPKLVVKKHRPLEIFLALILFSASFSVIVWLLLDANHWSFIKNRISWSQESRKLWEVNKDLESENAKLREKVIKLERLTKIDNETAERLQNDIRSLQDQAYRLKGELEFYQGIMSSTTDSKGLNIQGMHIEATDEDQIYRFKLVLTNVAKSDRVVEVTLDMSVEGMSEAGSRVLSLNDVIAGNAFNHNIKFKNFERIEGSLALPDGFKPLRVLVSLRQKGGQKSAVQRVFEWPAIAG